MTSHNTQATLFPDDDGIDEKSFADIHVGERTAPAADIAALLSQEGPP